MKYIEQNLPRKNVSKLFPFYTEMKSMREQGYSYRQISEALQENGIQAYPSEIKRYMDRKSSAKPHNQIINKVESSKQTVSKFLDAEPKG